MANPKRCTVQTCRCWPFLLRARCGVRPREVGMPLPEGPQCHTQPDERAPLSSSRTSSVGALRGTSCPMPVRRGQDGDEPPLHLLGLPDHIPAGQTGQIVSGKFDGDFGLRDSSTAKPFDCLFALELYSPSEAPGVAASWWFPYPVNIFILPRPRLCCQVLCRVENLPAETWPWPGTRGARPPGTHEHRSRRQPAR